MVSISRIWFSRRFELWLVRVGPVMSERPERSILREREIEFYADPIRSAPDSPDASHGEIPD